MNKELRNFVVDFIDGVECRLMETNKTTCYVDCELAEILGVDNVNDIDNDILNDVMSQIVDGLRRTENVDAYISSSNEITAYKID